MRHVLLFVRWIVSTRLNGVWFCTQKTCVSVAATASMLVRSVRHNTRRPGIMAHAARWINVPSVQVDLKTICPNLNFRNMDVIVSQRASCRFALRCVQPKRFWQVTETRSLTSSASGLCCAASAQALGVGHSLPTKKWLSCKSLIQKWGGLGIHLYERTRPF